MRGTLPNPKCIPGTCPINTHLWNNTAPRWQFLPGDRVRLQGRKGARRAVCQQVTRGTQPDLFDTPHVEPNLSFPHANATNLVEKHHRRFWHRIFVFLNFLGSRKCERKKKRLVLSNPRLLTGHDPTRGSCHEVIKIWEVEQGRVQRCLSHHGTG